MYFQEPPRCDAGQPIRLTALGKAGKELPGEVVDRSGRALHLLVDTPMEVGTAVKAECNDTLMLGEVCQCHPVNGQYAVGLTLEHSLMDTAELARLAQRLLEEDRATEAHDRRSRRA